MAGTKETKELLDGVVALAVAIIEVSKDGVQFQDALTLFGRYQSDPVFKATLDEAVAGISGVGAEVNDLDTNEIIELVVHVAQKVPKILDALK